MSNINLYGNRNPFQLLQNVFDDIVINFSVMLNTTKYAASRDTSEMVPTYDGTDMEIREYTNIRSLTMSDIPEDHPLAVVFSDLLISRVDYIEKHQATYENEMQAMYFIIDERDPDVEYKFITPPMYTIRIKHTADRMQRRTKLNYEVDILSGDYADTPDSTSGSPVEMSESFLRLISIANDRLHNLNIIFNKCKDFVRYPVTNQSRDGHQFLKEFFDQNSSGAIDRRFFYYGLMTYRTRSGFIAEIIKNNVKMNELLAKHPVDADGVPDSKAFGREIVGYLNDNDIYLSHWDDLIRKSVKYSFDDSEEVGQAIDQSILDIIYNTK